MVKFNEFEFETVVKNTDYIVRDHRVHQVRIMPGVTFIEMVYRILKEEGYDLNQVELRDILFKEPVATTDTYDQKIKLTLESELKSGIIKGVSQKFKDGRTISAEWVLNFQCEIRSTGKPLSKTIDIDELKGRAIKTVDMDQAYSYARKVDINHYEFMKALGQVYIGEKYLLAELHLSDIARKYLAYSFLHPVYLDAATVLPGLFLFKREDFTEVGHLIVKPYIPLYIERFRANAGFGDRCFIYAPEAKNILSPSRDVSYSDLELYDSHGKIVASFHKLAAKQIRSKDLIRNLEKINKGLELKPIEESSPVSSETVKGKTEKVISENTVEGIGQSHDVKKTMENDLRQMIAAILGKSVSEVSLEEGYYEQGLDSSQLLQIVRNLENKLSRQLYPTLLFEYTNIRDLADYMAEKFGSAYCLPNPVNQDDTSDEPVKVMYYRQVWETSAFLPVNQGLHGRYLIFDTGERWFETLKELLTRGKNDVRIALVKPGKSFQVLGDGIFSLNPGERDDYRLLFQALDREGLLPDKILHRWSIFKGPFQADSISSQLELGIYSVCYLSQELMARKIQDRLQLLYIYSSEASGEEISAPASDDPDAASPMYATQPQCAAVSGFAGTVRLENPKFRYKTLRMQNIPGGPPLIQLAEMVLQEFLNDAEDEIEICYTGTQRFVRRLREVEPDRKERSAMPVKEGGVYLITGGAGGLGLIFAKHLCERARVKLVLSGRSDLSEAQIKQLKELEDLGSEIYYLKADVSDRQKVAGLVATIKSRYHHLNGVIHAAGVIRDAFVVKKAREEMEAVFAAKVFGTVFLDEALRDEVLDFFILFSSTTAVLGNIGQSDYAFANSFMDNYAELRELARLKKHRFGRTFAINWPLWRDGGMKVDGQSESLMKTNSGLVPLNTDYGIQAFDDGFYLSYPQLMVVEGEEERVKTFLGNRLSDAQVASRRQNDDSSCYQVDTVAYPQETEESEEESIAVIGIGGRYPLAEDVEEFWENLKMGRDCVTEIPKERWDYREYYDPDKEKLGTSYSKWGGFISGADKFDPLFFNIAPREAEFMDPQARLFLETVWNTIEDAGYAKSLLEKLSVGVFVGVMWSQYQLFEMDVNGKKISPMSSFASIANRVSYYFNFHGPSIALDTMCSSSLTAIHLACESIRRKESELAIAGGVNLSLHPKKYTILSQGKFVSSDGRCRSFGEGGDGYVPGEGVGAVLLKPLAKAIRDRDQIYGVIKASSLNHGGRANGYSVPNPHAQAKLIMETLKKSGVTPRTISYIETHGTGTSLGDPIELTGLVKAFGEEPGDAYCAIGSVKSNIGHLESAAGIAALTKVLFQMKNKVLTPSIHAEKLNPNLTFNGTPFHVQQQLTEWKQPVIMENGAPKTYPRRAGISAFGAGGANAHVILEEYETNTLPEAPSENSPQLIILSAKTEERLKDYARKLLDYLEKKFRCLPDESIGMADASFADEMHTSITDIAFTLQVGREAMEERLAIIAANPRELSRGLTEYLQGQKAGLNVFRGKSGLVKEQDEQLSAKPAQDISEMIQSRDLGKLAEMWVSGVNIEWARLYRNRSPKRVSLPTYPFAGKRYWIGSFAGPTATGGSDKNQPAASTTPRTSLSPKTAAENRSASILSERAKTYRGNEVVLKIIDGNIALVTMQDRKNTNMFSENIILGLMAVFLEIARNEKIKVVIVTGYDRVFCMGGTREQLVNIADQKNSFTDSPFLYRGLLETEIPVISAIQGHASGGGLLFGLYADIVIMAEESVYSAVFTKYGFTPGMGATYILKEKLGNNLATEMMYTAKSFSGEELKQRCASVIFRKRADVLNEAVSIAKQLAEKPLPTLKILKKELAGRILEQLPGVIEREEYMHTQTFTNPEVKQRIDHYYHEQRNADKKIVLDAATTAEKTTPVKTVILPSITQIERGNPGQVSVMQETATGSPISGFMEGIENEPEVRGKIIEVVCNTLHLTEHDLDENVSFKDLGVDSISGVEIMRDINRLFNLKLDAVIIYDYSTINKLSQYVSSERQKIGLSLQNITNVNNSPESELLPPPEKPGAHKIQLNSTGAFKPLQEGFISGENVDIVGNGMSGRFPGANILVPPEKQIERVEPGQSSAMQETATGSPISGFMEGIENEPGVRGKVTEVVCNTLHLTENDLDENVSFKDLGVDSISGVEIMRDINRLFNLKLDAVVLYDFSTINKLSQYVFSEYEKIRHTIQGIANVNNYPVSDELSPPVETRAPKIKLDYVDQKEGFIPDDMAHWPPVSVKTVKTVKDERGKVAESFQAIDIAIIGMSGRFPGAKNLEEFWENIEKGIESTTEIPSDRWDINQYYDPDPLASNKTYCKVGGFLTDPDKFDPLFFNISPMEATMMDPQQRLFLEEAWRALEDAGYSDKKLSDFKCGVFVGTTYGDYGAYVNAANLGNTAQTFTGLASSILASRISYFLNLTGPSIALDTACSSSLVAIHQACQSIIFHESDMALAGGVSLMFTPDMFIKSSKNGMLSPSGKCRAFDQGADGIIISEGVGVVVLKPLRAALQDRDHIYGVIKGAGTNQDGKTNGITAPSAISQTRLESDVYARAGINPEQLSYIEAHGTGTGLGDPIEIRALKETFGKYTQRKQYCAIGSVKTNIGHCTLAAGVAGFIKLMLSLKRQKIPPILNFQQENEHINFTESPFYVNTRLQDWKPAPGMPRMAAISAFGYSGTNCHIVVEEAPEPSANPRAVSNPYYLFLLSAKNVTSLECKVRELSDWLDREGVNHTPGDISYTLSEGRSHFSIRVALIAGNIKELSQKLKALLAKGISKKLNEIQLKEAGKGKIIKELGVRLQTELEASHLLKAEEYLAKLEVLADLYMNGLDTGWVSLYKSGDYRRISLPTYPFMKERCWTPEQHKKSAEGRPLIDKLNPGMSLGHGIVFQKTIYNTDLIVGDHRVRGIPILPGVAYLEMAYEAASEVRNIDGLSLSGVVWLQPVIIQSEKAEIRIAIKLENEILKFEIQTCQDEQIIIHSRGEFRPAEDSGAKKGQLVDIDAIKSRCVTGLDQAPFYDEFREIGLDYGPFFQGVGQIWANADESLGYLNLPLEFAGDFEDYYLHPTLMDSSLQAISMLVKSSGQEIRQPLLPFSVEKVEILNRLKSCGYVYAKTVGKQRFHVAILDENGLVCVRLFDVHLREQKDPLEDFFYLPGWDPIGSAESKQNLLEMDTGLEKEKTVLLIISSGCPPSLEKGLTGVYTAKRLVIIRLGTENKQHSGDDWEINTSDPDALDNCIRQIDELSAICYLGGIQTSMTDPADLDALDRSQESGVISLFRLLKSLGSHGLNCQPLRLKIITNDVQTILSGNDTAPGINRPYSAGLHGLAKSIAKEYLNWEVSCIDISLEETCLASSEDEFSAVAKMIIGEPGNKKGDEVVIRRGKRYVRSLRPIQVPGVRQLPFRKQGVYLILGGAGGIGLEFSRYLAQKVQARIILLGRSTLSAGQKEKIAGIESLGGKVLYLQADATDLKSMSSAVAKAKEYFGEINGVIHSAIVLRDKTLEKMDEDTFREALAPKVRGSVVLYQALQGEELDFMLFFSSIQSFTGNPGQGNYAAACAFKDAFAHFWSQRVPYPVKIINWGYWGSVGVVADEKHNKIMAGIGVHSIRPEEGMEAIGRVLAHRSAQIMGMRAERKVLVAIGVDLQNRVDPRPAVSPDAAQNVRIQSVSPVVAAKKRNNVEEKTQNVAREEEIKQSITDTVINCLVKTLGVKYTDIDMESQFSEYGVDSVTGLELIKSLNDSFGITLKNTVLFDYSNVNNLSCHIAESYGIVNQKIEVLVNEEKKPLQKSVTDAPFPVADPGETTNVIKQSIAPVVSVDKRNIRQERNHNVATEEEIKQSIAETVINCLVKTLGVKHEDIDMESQFSEYGVDSVTGLELIKSIDDSLGITLKTTVLFDYSNVNDITRHIYEEYRAKITTSLTIPGTSKPEIDTIEDRFYEILAKNPDLLEKLANGELSSEAVYQILEGQDG